TASNAARTTTLEGCASAEKTISERSSTPRSVSPSSAAHATAGTSETTSGRSAAAAADDPVEPMARTAAVTSAASSVEPRRRRSARSVARAAECAYGGERHVRHLVGDGEGDRSRRRVATDGAQRFDRGAARARRFGGDGAREPGDVLRPADHREQRAGHGRLL